MKLFSVTGLTIRDGDITGLYVVNTDEEALERFSKEYEDYTFFHENVEEIKIVDNYEVILKKINKQNEVKSMNKVKNPKPLTEDKKKMLKEHMGSCSSKIDFNKVRDEWRSSNENCCKQSGVERRFK